MAGACVGTNDPNNILLEMIDVNDQAVVAAGKLSTTWGAVKKR